MTSASLNKSPYIAPPASVSAVSSSAASSSLVQTTSTITQKPIALILKAEYDHNGSISQPSGRFFLRTLAQTHHVIRRIIQQSSDIEREINATPGADLLIIHAHGRPDLIRLGNGWWWNSYYFQPRFHDFENLSPRAQIFLLSCQTGNGLAQKIADASYRRVTAPITDINSLGSFLSFCKDHQSLEVRTNHLFYDCQSMIQYQKGKTPIYCIDYPNIDYFIGLEKFLKTEAEELLDPSAAMELGDLYVLQDKKDLAKEYYKKAADSSSETGRAYWKLSEIYLSEGFRDLEETYLKLSADRGYAPAKLALAFKYLSRAVAFLYEEKDPIQAMFWFEKAKKLNSLSFDETIRFRLAYHYSAMRQMCGSLKNYAISTRCGHWMLSTSRNICNDCSKKFDRVATWLATSVLKLSFHP